jgi:hypothetical protein
MVWTTFEQTKKGMHGVHPLSLEISGNAVLRSVMKIKGLS